MSEWFYTLPAFQNERFALLKIYMVEKNDFISKIDLKDTPFFVPLGKGFWKYVKFAWLGNLWEFFCFGLGRAPRIFTKLLKIIPIALQRRLNIRLMIYLDSILIIGKTLEEMSWDTTIFFTSALWFYNKYQNISSGTNTKNRVSGWD